MSDRRFPAALAIVLLLTGWSWTLHGQAQPQPAPPAASETANDEVTERSAPVVVDGETLFHVVGVRIFPADVRAQAISERIQGIAADASFDPASLRLEVAASDTAVMAGSRVVVRLLDNDARLEGVPRAYLGDIVLGRIRHAIVQHRLERRPSALLRSSAVDAAWGIVLGLSLWLTHRLLGRLQRWIERRFGGRLRDVRIQSVSLVSAEQIWRLVAIVLRGAWVAGALVAVLVYLRFALVKFPWTRGVGLALADFFLQPLQILGSGLLAALPNLVFLAVLAVVTRFVLRLIGLLFDRLEDGRLVFAGFEADWARPTYRIVRVLIFALAAVVAYPYIPGSSSDAFKGVSVFIGVVFSLGSSSIIGNALAGLSIPYRRAFRVGDVVQIGEHFGTVERIRTLVTHIRTVKNEDVTIPNSVILGTQVMNYSTRAETEGVIMHTTVGIGYETPWRQVEAMLLEAASRVPGIRTAPAPFVLQRALADFCVTYEINAYISDPTNLLVLYSSLHANILDVFNEYGVQIMTPAYMADPSQPKVVPKTDWYAAPAKAPGTAVGSGSEQAGV